MLIWIFHRALLYSVCVNNLILLTLRVWDEADYVVPPAENGAFFITTNVLITSNQTQVGWH